MRFVIQRVETAAVETDGLTVGEIGKGLLVLVGISGSDDKQTAEKMVKKLLALRIFEDDAGKTNLDLKSVAGSLLLVSQFTLYADCRKGNRPSFTKAGPPDMANELYEYIIEKCRESVETVEKGVFGADMKVSLVNSGPFSVILDSDELF